MTKESFMEKVRAGQIPNVSIDFVNPATAYTSMALDTPPGIKVRFTGYGGYSSHQEHARKFLDVDDYYVVKKIDIIDYFSKVTFEEFPDEAFNTVMFEAALV